jgi:hypothetical protein
MRILSWSRGCSRFSRARFRTCIGLRVFVHIGILSIISGLKYFYNILSLNFTIRLQFLVLLNTFPVQCMNPNSTHLQAERRKVLVLEALGWPSTFSESPTRSFNFRPSFSEYGTYDPKTGRSGRPSGVRPPRRRQASDGGTPTSRGSAEIGAGKSCRKAVGPTFFTDEFRFFPLSIFFNRLNEPMFSFGLWKLCWLIWRH